MSEPINQHFIPVCYLKQFVDPNTPANYEPYVWIFDRKTKISKKKAPKNILYIKDLYTVIVNGEKRDYRIENTLSKIESKYSEIYNKKIKNKLPLSEYEHVSLCVFVSTMLQRTLKNRDNLEKFIDDLISHGLPIKSGNKIHEINDLIKYRKNIHKKSVINTLPDISNLLFSMSVAFLCPKKDKDYFITSDDPCNLFNPDLQWQRSYGPGLGQKNIQVTLPLSPDILLCLSWSNLKGYIELGSSWINNLNRLIYAKSYKNFISHKNKKKFVWFMKYPLNIFFVTKVIIFKIKTLFHKFKYRFKYGRN